MSFITRREFGAAVLASAAAASARETKVGGVRIGVGTYTFRGMALNDFIPIVTAAGLSGIELDSPFVEPKRAAGLTGPLLPEEREQIRRWRLSVPLAEFTGIRKKLEKAGLAAYAYFVAMNDSFTDEELDRVLQMAKALGTNVLNTQATLPVAKRIAPLAEKRKVIVALHPSSGATPPTDAIGSGDSYRKAFAISPNLHACLDLYLHKNWGSDPVTFLKEVHERITTLHLHDRKTSATPAQWAPLGGGDLPVKDLLLLAKENKYKFTFSIERMYQFPGLDQLTELRRGVEYCRQVLG